MIAVALIAGKPIATEQIVQHLSVTGALPAVVTELVRAIAIAMAGDEMEIRVTPEDLQEAADAFRRSAGLIDAEDVQRFFDARGWRLEDFETHLEKLVLKNRVRERAVPNNRVESAFRERNPEFRMYAISRILVEEQDVANEILAQLRDGELRFDDAARQHSREGTSAPGGGYAGFMRLTQFPPEMRGALHGARTGSLLGPFPISGGFALLKIEDVREAEFTPAIAEEIAENLFNEWLADRMKALEPKLIRPASLPERPKAPDPPPAE